MLPDMTQDALLRYRNTRPRSYNPERETEEI
jgi:hypothetical protein